jgi:erythronate-4-phosphate dehydrogenase
MRIVVDDAIGWAAEAFAPFGTVDRVRGREITRARVIDADALVVRTVTRVTAELVQGTQLGFVGSATAGIDHVDVDALQAAGIRFASAAGCNAHAVVDYVLTALHLEALERNPEVLRGPVAIVGFGHVGRRLAARLRSLGATVRVTDPPLAERIRRGELEPADPWDALAIAAPLMPLHDAVAGAAVLSMHTPLTTDGPHPTRSMVDLDLLERLAPGAIFVNASRGEVVDGGAVATWLARARGHAVLDVWPCEPEIDAALALQPRVRIATPHIAGYSLEGKVTATAAMVRALAEHVGVPATWDGATILGEPVALAVPAHASALARATAALRTCQPIERDTDALRALARAPAPRAAGFEGLRRDYELRRSLAHFVVDGDLEPHLVAAGMRARATEALVLLAHGSPDPDWRIPIDALLEHTRARMPHRVITAAFLDHLPPSLDAAIASLEPKGVTAARVVPIFLSGGGNHIKRDIPALCERVAAAHPAVSLRLEPGAIGNRADVVAALARATVDLATRQP